MKLTIVSSYADLAKDLAVTLEAATDEIDIRSAETKEFVVRHAPGVPSRALADLKAALRPLEPEIAVDRSLSGDAGVLHLGDARPLRDWRLKVFSESADVRTAVSSGLRKSGFKTPTLDTEPQLVDRLQFGGASPFAQNVILWRLARAGHFPVPSQVWGEDDPDIFVCLVDPELGAAPPAERVMVEIRSDDPDAAILAKETLRRAGFPRAEIKLCAGGGRKGCGEALSVDPGPLARLGYDLESAGLMSVAGELARACDIDPARYPVRMTQSNSPVAVLRLPIAACRERRLAPYAGAFPERFRISLHTDERTTGNALRHALVAKGFTQTTRRSLDDVTSGFCVHFGAAHGEPAILEAVREAVEDHMIEIGADTVALALLRTLPEESTDIVIHAPSAAFKDGTLAREMENPLLYNAYVRGGDDGQAGIVKAVLERLGFAAAERRSASDTHRPQLSFGAAPRLLIERIRDAIQEATDVTLPIVKDRSITDRDIWLVLPERTKNDNVPLPAPAHQRASGTVRSSGRRTRGRAFVTVLPDRLEIGTETVPRHLGGDLTHVPKLDLFGLYCLDATTAETLLHIFTSFRLGEPCALEGATSTSKTSVIMYAAALLGHPMFRLNLNGHADTGDLIGRYVPGDNGTWPFLEGLLVTAMRNGYWLVIDELNLAETSVLERLNPALERFPSLVLSEHDYSVIAAPREGFQMFATFNTAGEYVGREPMSPALRDRWLGYRYVPRAGENEYLAQARLAVHGLQPEISVHGERYGGSQGPAPLANLGRIRGIDDFLRALSRFQVSFEAAVEADDNGTVRLGAGRRDQYVATRRGFLGALRYVDLALEANHSKRTAVAAGWSAVERYYLNRMASAPDRSTVIDLACAAGISPDSWKA
jgi:hypothetical protein